MRWNGDEGGKQKFWSIFAHFFLKGSKIWCAEITPLTKPYPLKIYMRVQDQNRWGAYFYFPTAPLKLRPKVERSKKWRFLENFQLRLECLSTIAQSNPKSFWPAPPITTHGLYDEHIRICFRALLS